MLYLCIIITILIGYILLFRRKEQKKKKLEQLKNALLTFAMTKVFDDSFEKGPITINYDGSVLPPLSGYNMSNACFSYIIDSDEFKKHPWHTEAIARKHKAIERFLDINLNTSEQVQEFFNKFVKSIDPKKE